MHCVRLVFAAAILLTSCSRAPLPNVLLVTFDTTRYDRFGCTGDPEARTPVVDALAGRGLLFENAYATAPLTLPSHTTMLTGLTPIAHGVHHNGRFRVPDELDTLAEILSGHGYRTAAFVSAFVLDPRYNLGQGFATYSAETRRKSDPLALTVPQRPGVEVTDDALRWLEARGPDAPFFLWAHYYDPHAPRSAEPPFDALRDTYRAEIAYADAQLGRLLEGVKRAAAGRDTLVVFTADHGESLGQHGEMTHGILAYDSTLHVPLILAGPGVPGGARSDVLARHVDLVPTILARAGLAVPEGLPGRDLVSTAAERRSADGAVAAGADAVVDYFETQGPHFDLGWSSIAGVRTAQWKYTESPAPPELYDVRADPDEQRNLSSSRPDVVADLAARYAELRRTQARPDLESERQDLDTNELEQLAALGYVEAAPLELEEEPDPRRFVTVHGWVSHARSAARRGQYERAIEVLETLVESPSVRALVVRTLAPIYAEAGRLDDAIRTYRRYIELTDAPEARLGLGRTLLRAQRFEEALAALDAIAPASTHVQIVRARVLARLGRSAEARRIVDAAYAGEHRESQRLRARSFLVLEVAPVPDGEEELRRLAAAAPDDAVLESRLGFYLAVWGGAERRDEALARLRAAAALEPQRAEIQSNLGWGLYRLGAAEQAREALATALSLDETRARDRFRLAGILQDVGEREQALEQVRSALAVRPAADWSDAARSLESEIVAELGTSGGARS